MGAQFSLTLNQDKRRWFDSTPGSIFAGRRAKRPAEEPRSGTNCAHYGAHTVKRSETPPAQAVHAAAVAARAAVVARRGGACPDVAARVYADAYVCALLEDAA